MPEGRLPTTRELVERLSDIEMAACLSGGAVGSRPSRDALVATLTPAELWADDGCRAAMWRAFTDAERRVLAQRVPGVLASGAAPPTGPQLGGLLESMGVALWGPPLERLRQTAAPGYGLFPHQRAVVSAAQSLLWRSADRRVILHLPTGGGKTRCAMHIVCQHLSATEPGLVVWLATSPELLGQGFDEFISAWAALGNREVATARFAGDADVSALDVADGLMVAGLGKMAELHKRNGPTLRGLSERTTLVVFDEAHQAIAPTYRAVVETLSGMNPDCAVLGLTATPGRTWSDIAEDEKLAAFWGRNIASMPAPSGYGSPVDFLIHEGYLARPVFRCLRLDPGLPAESTREVRGGEDYSSEQLDSAAADNEFTRAVHRTVVELLEGGMHDRVLVFAASVGHARALAVALASDGHDAACVTGVTPDARRQSILDRFTSNAPGPMAVINFGVLTAGFDAPQVSAVLIARPTRSLVLFSQMVGRGTRGVRAGGTQSCEIVSVIPSSLPGFGDLAEAFSNWNDVYEGSGEQ